jgi:LAO/AO transport system kinase
MTELVSDLLDGNHSALARVITQIENREPGYRDLVSALYEHTGSAHVIGVTGSPGAGKSTLVDAVVSEYRDQGHTVGVIAIDPSSPYSGGAVLGDRIRMSSTAGDMDVFFRSMSARGALGGLSSATTDTVTALDAFGKGVIIIETVGAGQNEIDIVRTAETVTVLVPPGSGDDVQMLKAGILEIGDIFVVNKADLDGADRTVQQLREMIHGGTSVGHHGTVGTQLTDANDEVDSDTENWEPPIVETVATRGEGITEFIGAAGDHNSFLDRSGKRDQQARKRVRDEIQTLLREDVNELLADELGDTRIESAVDRVIARETDPYTAVEELLAPVRNCVE